MGLSCNKNTQAALGQKDYQELPTSQRSHRGSVSHETSAKMSSETVVAEVTSSVRRTVLEVSPCEAGPSQIHSRAFAIDHDQRAKVSTNFNGAHSEPVHEARSPRLLECRPSVVRAGASRILEAPSLNSPVPWPLSSSAYADVFNSGPSDTQALTNSPSSGGSMLSETDSSWSSMVLRSQSKATAMAVKLTNNAADLSRKIAPARRPSLIPRKLNELNCK